LGAQVEVSYFFHNFAFSVRVPSQLYLNKTEGLCGSCNGNSSDDMCKPDGQLTEDVNEFGLSWLVKNLLQDSPQKDEESCQVQPQPECIPPPPEDDLCLKLVDDSTFKVLIGTFCSLKNPLTLIFV
jgi:von Willebrand factor